MGTVISDSACLIGLSNSGQLEMLQKVYPRVLIPPAVVAEFGEIPPWITVQKPQNELAVKLAKLEMDPGEAEAAVLGLEMNLMVVLDDKLARKIACRMGVKVIGTVGVLLKAKDMGHISALKPALVALRKAGFYISDRLLDDAVHLAGEE